MDKKYNQFIKINKEFGQFKTKRELAMFLTHILVESMGLMAKEELKCLETGCPGEYLSVTDYPGRRYYGKLDHFYLN